VTLKKLERIIWWQSICLHPWWALLACRHNTWD